MNRIENLRSVALAHSHSDDEFYLLFCERYSNSTEKSEYARYSDAFYYALSNLVPHVTSGELAVLETCGFADRNTFLSVIEYCDFVLFDIKETDGELHRRYTGVHLRRAKMRLDSGSRTYLRTL